MKVCTKVHYSTIKWNLCLYSCTVYILYHSISHNEICRLFSDSKWYISSIKCIDLLHDCASIIIRTRGSYSCYTCIGLFPNTQTHSCIIIQESHSQNDSKFSDELLVTIFTRKILELILKFELQYISHIEIIMLGNNVLVLKSFQSSNITKWTNIPVNFRKNSIF